MAEQDGPDPIQPEFPTGRIRKIMKLDKDINKVNSEALFLVTCSMRLFLDSLAEKSAEIAIEKKRKTVKLEHIRLAVKRHRSISDFLLDSLPEPAQSVVAEGTDKVKSKSRLDKPAPVGTKRISDFFSKATTEVTS